MNDSKVVFLDEPSGAMDVASERALVANLKNAFPPDTSILVSTHRYSLLELVDRIIVLDNGRLVADGPKDKVLAELSSRASKAAGGKAQSPQTKASIEKLIQASTGKMTQCALNRPLLRSIS